MNEISSNVAFWILGTWRKTSAQLHWAKFGEKLESGSKVVISSTTPKLSRFSLVEGGPNGQKTECPINLENCKFSLFAANDDSPFKSGAGWAIVLVIELPNGKKMLFAEPTE